MLRLSRSYPYLILGFFLTACAPSAFAALPPPTAAPTVALTVTPLPSPAPTPIRTLEVLDYRVAMTHPHDADAFTQGLVFTGDRLFESTGLRGRSSLREVDLETGRVLRRVDIPAPIFAEGLALVGDELIQITWQEFVAIRYDRDTFAERGRWTYAGEGWGLAYDGARLIMSDGSSTIRFRDPRTFEETGSIVVTLDGEPIERINELEWIDGMIWANVWQTDLILRIDPADGMVTGVLDLEGLLSTQERASADVLNGIAWNPRTSRMLVTGKLWPHLFEIEIVRR